MRSRISYRSTGIILILARLLVQVLSDELTSSEEHGFHNFNDTKYQNSVEEPGIMISKDANSNMQLRSQREHNDTKYQNSAEKPAIRLFDGNTISKNIHGKGNAIFRGQMEHNDTKYQNSAEKPAIRLFDGNRISKNIHGNNNIILRSQMKHNDTKYQNSAEKPAIRLFDGNQILKSISGEGNAIFRGQIEHNDTKYQNSVEKPVIRLFDGNQILKSISGEGNAIFRGQMEHNDTKYQNSAEEPGSRLFDDNIISKNIHGKGNIILRGQMEHNDTKQQNSVEEPGIRLFDDNIISKNIHGKGNIILRGQMEHNDTKYQNSVEEPVIRVFDNNQILKSISGEGNAIFRGQMQHNDTKYQNSVEEPGIRLFDDNLISKNIHGKGNVIFRGQMEHNDTKDQNSVEEPVIRIIDANQIRKNINGNNNIIIRSQMEHNDTKYQNSVEEPGIRLFDGNQIWKNIKGSNNIILRSQMEHTDKLMPASVKNAMHDVFEDELIMKLYGAIIFRENILRVFNYVLYVAESKISANQYSSLYMIHEALRRNLGDVCEMLPITHLMPKMKKNLQWDIILLSLSKNLPPYLESTATFLRQELYDEKFKPEDFFPPGVKDLPDFLENLDIELINLYKTISFNNERNSYDKSSERTEKTLGPVLAEVLYKIKTGTINFTQRLFAAILMNLPQNGADPIFDENIRYIFELSIVGLIPFPKNVDHIPKEVDLYELINYTISKILTGDDIPIFIRESLFYISNHLSPITVTHMNPMHNPMKRIVSNRFNVKLLLSSIVLYDFSPDAVHLRDRLLYFIQKDFIDMEIMLDGMKTFIYNNPMDLLIALLSRMQKRIRPSDIEIQHTISALLSTLLLKKEMCTFSPNISPSIDITTILGYLQNPGLNHTLTKVADSLYVHILNHPDELNNLNTLIPLEKKQCVLPSQCIVNAVSHIKNIKNRITYEKVKRLKIKITDSLNIWKDPCLNDSLAANATDNEVPKTISPADDDKKNPMIPLIHGHRPSPPTSTPPPLDTTTSTDTATTATGTTAIPTTPTDGTTTTESPPGTEKPFGPERPCCLLPSGIRPNAKIYVGLSIERIPSSISTNKKALGPSTEIIILPSIMFLMSPPNVKKLFGKWGTHFKRAILNPLKSIYGTEYLVKIFKSGLIIHYYPTNVALVLALLEKALMLSEVSGNMELYLAIEKYIGIINYVSIVLLVPIMSQYNHIKSNVIYSIIDYDDPMTNHILQKSPKFDLQGAPCFPLLHPKYYIQAVDQENPYAGLLPAHSEVSSAYQCIAYRLLQKFLDTGALNKLLGSYFNPRAYPNRGTLLCDILKGLGKLPFVQANDKLSQMVTGYLQAIRFWAMYTYVPSTFISTYPFYGPNEVPSAEWTPDLPDLITLLPPDRTPIEASAKKQLKLVLLKKNLLDVIKVPKPPTDTKRSVLLIQIIEAILNPENADITPVLGPVLKHYVEILKTKPMFDGTISYIWSRMYPARAEFRFHELLSNSVLVDQSPLSAKIAYKSVLNYFNRHPERLRDLPNFGLITKDTQGLYLRRLFVYLALNSKMTPSVTRNIKTFIPYIDLKESDSNIEPM